MATVMTTIIEIEYLQNEIEALLKKGSLQQNKFIEDIMNFTTVYYFELLSHGSLESIKNRSLIPHNKMIKKYFSLFNQKMVLQEYIRWQNIGGLFIIWNIFEKMVRTLHQKITKGAEKSLEDSYKEILKHRKLNNKQYTEMLEEFNAIRLTRNSLHKGGIYKFSKKKENKLAGELYKFEQGKEVKPIRLMTVIRVMWNHYLSIVLIK